MFGEKTLESSTTTGTGAYALGTSVGAFKTWRSQIADGGTAFYYAENGTGTIWEAGYGTLTYGSPDSLSRTLIASSTGSLVSWVGGDAPIYVMSTPTAAALKHLLAPLASGTRPAWLPSGGLWLDYALGLAVGWVKKRWNGTAEMEEGRYYISPAIFAASQRALFEDKGAANYTFTAADIGKVLCFDTTASARVLTMLANSVTGMGHGAYVYVMPYGSVTNGVTFTPGGADTTDVATAPPGRMTRFQWDGAKSTWRSDATVYGSTPTAGDSSLKVPTTAFVTSAVAVVFPRYSIGGWTYANNGSDATNDIDIAAGAGADSTNADIIVGAALTKRLDAAWAVGTNQGGLDTGAIGNSDYYIHAIKRVDTGVVDYLFSLSATAPTMPTNYTLRRLIGWFKRVSATIVPFLTYEMAGGGLHLQWTAPTLDVDLATTLTTSRRTDAVKVPLNFSVIANLRVSATHGATPFVALVGCPDHTDVAPSDTATPLGNINYSNNGTNVEEIRVRTSAAGLIAARSSVASITVYRVVTMGFEWSRR